MLLAALETIAGDLKKSRLFNSNPEKFFELFPELSVFEKKLLLERNAAAIESYLKSGSNVMASAASTTVVTVIVIFRNPHDDGVLAMRNIFNNYWDRVMGNCVNLSQACASA